MEEKLIFREEANGISNPVLPEGIKNYLIDIDGTICDDIPNEQPEKMITAKAFTDALNVIKNGMNKGILSIFLLLEPKNIDK